MLGNGEICSDIPDVFCGDLKMNNRKVLDRTVFDFVQDDRKSKK